MSLLDVEQIARIRKSPFGCLADGCEVNTKTYPEIDAHMVSAHDFEPDPNL